MSNLNEHYREQMKGINEHSVYKWLAWTRREVWKNG